MPEILRPFDRAKTAAIGEKWQPPKSFRQAVWRGMCNQCPRCGRKKFFWSFLKPILLCMHCGQDWTAERAHDFPAYLAILVSGHFMAPLMITLISSGELELWAIVAIILTLALMLLLALLQPAKGAVIAAQWWLGMHGFEKPAE